MNSIFLTYTWKNIKENKNRTLVTVIGILLSVALLTAVTVSISSVLKYLEAVAIWQTGDWAVNIYEADEEQLRSWEEDSRVTNIITVENIGYAQIGSSNTDKPYLYIGAVETDFTDDMPITLEEGRMPENDGELLIPVHLYNNGQVRLALGQTITLQLGRRQWQEDDGSWEDWEDTRMNQHEGFKGEGYDTQETFVPDGRSVTYTVVGFYSRPDFEARIAPGYTALTIRGETVSGTGVYETWIALKDLKYADGFLSDQKKDGLDGELNTVLMRYSGYSDSDVMTLLYTLAGILMILVVVGSVSLIYNAFSISVTERIRQFGLLKSLGATKRQITGTIVWEGLLLCAVAIPLGIGIGCVGIGVTIWLCQDLFQAMFGDFSQNVVFPVYASGKALGLTISLSLITVLISAWLPARKVLRMSAIDSVRQSDEIQIRAKEVRTSPLTMKLFGLEGVLASKNFKRSRKRYWATVVSLFFTLTLFITANSFCHYLNKSIEDSLLGDRYDLCCYLPEADWEEAKELFQKLEGTNTAEEGVLVNRITGRLTLAEDSFTKEYLEYWKERWYGNQESEWTWHWTVVFVEDNAYGEYLEKNGLDAKQYLDTEHPTALVYDRMVIYEEETGGTYVIHTLSDQAEELCIWYPKEKEDDSEEEKGAPWNVAIGSILEEAPWFTYGVQPQVFLPASLMEEWGVTTERGSVWAYFMAEDAAGAYTVMEQYTSAFPQGAFLNNNSQNVMQTRALLTLIEVFTTGFLVLISLVCAANVFNTVSTNIMLRRREFAMLKSIGLEQKRLRRILNYECLRYGIKSLLYALPVSTLFTWLIYERIKSEGFFTGFYIPWQTMVVAVGAVFILVFATMGYSVKKLEKDELADVIRMENA